MAVGAHADDLEISIGGTLAKYHSLGYKISYVLTTNNMSGNWCRLKSDGTVDYQCPAPDVIMPQRKLEAEAGAKCFGTKPVHLDYPQRHYFGDGGKQVDLTFGSERPSCVAPDTPSILTAPDHKESVKQLSDLILKENPEAVLSFGPSVVNIEHYATALLAAKAYWQAVKSGYGGMLLNWLDITPSIFGEMFSRWDTFVDTSDYHEMKMKAISCHASQVPRPEALDLPPWGVACGCRHAEAFTITNTGAPKEIFTTFKTEILANIRKGQIK